MKFKTLLCAVVMSIGMTNSLSFAADSTAFWPSDVYATPTEFEKARQFVGLSQQISVLQGGLADPEKLLGALALLSEGEERFEKLYGCAYLSYAANQRDTAAQERYRGLKNTAAQYENTVGVLRSELQQLPSEYLRQCAERAAFAPYAIQLQQLAARGGNPHENISLLQAIQPSIAVPSEVASIVLNADFNAKEVKTPDGKRELANAAALSSALSKPDKAYRRDMYNAYYEGLQQHRNTLAATLEAHIAGRVQQAQLISRDANHETQMLVARYEMPEETADVLLRAVTVSLPIYRRGAQQQARALKQDSIAPYDVVPSPESQAGQYTYEEAVTLVLDAVAPLGDIYMQHAKRILQSNHVNTTPSAGKQGGAFCMSAGWGTDPYIHLNFDGSLQSVETLAHELGHAVHTVLARETQNREQAKSALATTETAAIVNEVLLMRHIIAHAKNDSKRKAAETSYAGLIGATLYQQTRYFAFERAAYQLIEEGGVLTADKGDALWAAISAPYWGTAVKIPAVASGAWSSIPHLYRDFYVVNYAFSMAAAETFADQIEKGHPEPYLTMLRAGGVQPAYELFASRGVDFLSGEAYNTVIAKLDLLYDHLEPQQIAA